jgi:uncharacterized protein YjbJ (UPF0337 family)
MRFSIALLAAGFGLVAPQMASHAQTAKITPDADQRTKRQEGAIVDDASNTWAKFKGAWTQTKGAVKVKWAKLTDDDMLEIDGRREILVGKIETRYGVSRKEAELQVTGFENSR